MDVDETSESSSSASAATPIRNVQPAATREQQRIAEDSSELTTTSSSRVSQPSPHLQESYPTHGGNFMKSSSSSTEENGVRTPWHLHASTAAEKDSKDQASKDGHRESGRHLDPLDGSDSKVTTGVTVSQEGDGDGIALGHRSDGRAASPFAASSPEPEPLAPANEAHCTSRITPSGSRPAIRTFRMVAASSSSSSLTSTSASAGVPAESHGDAAQQQLQERKRELSLSSSSAALRRIAVPAFDDAVASATKEKLSATASATFSDTPVAFDNAASITEEDPRGASTSAAAPSILTTEHLPVMAPVPAAGGYTSPLPSTAPAALVARRPNRHPSSASQTWESTEGAGDGAPEDEDDGSGLDTSSISRMAQEALEAAEQESPDMSSMLAEVVIDASGTADSDVSQRRRRRKEAAQSTTGSGEEPVTPPSKRSRNASFGSLHQQPVASSSALDVAASTLLVKETENYSAALPQGREVGSGTLLPPSQGSSPSESSSIFLVSPPHEEVQTAAPTTAATATPAALPPRMWAASKKMLRPPSPSPPMADHHVSTAVVDHGDTDGDGDGDDDDIGARPVNVTLSRVAVPSPGPTTAVVDPSTGSPETSTITQDESFSDEEPVATPHDNVEIASSGVASSLHEVDNDRLREQATSTGNGTQALQEAGMWNRAFSEMTLKDLTPSSQLYERILPPVIDESVGDDEEGICIMKVLSFFPMAATDAQRRWQHRADIQQRLLALAAVMRKKQRALDAAGLTTLVVPDSNSQSEHSLRSEAGLEVCCGILSVQVDSSCRLIARLEDHPSSIALRDLSPALCSAALKEDDIVSILRLVALQASALHNAGFVHGALHSGNILLSSYDGNILLSNPEGIMSNLINPADPSVISVARAKSMRSSLQEVWNMELRQRSQVVATPSRVGAPPPLSTEELLTYHAMACLGWLQTSENPSTVPQTDNTGKATGTTDLLSTPSYTATIVDDVYGLGMIAFLLYVGLPAFQGCPLLVVVERLTELAEKYTAAPSAEARRSLLQVFCFGDGPSSLRTTSYMRQRAVEGGYRVEFVERMERFIVDCVEASCVAACLQDTGAKSSSTAYDSVDALLARHPLLSIVADAEVAQLSPNDGYVVHEEELQELKSDVHRIVYPAYSMLTKARQHCGSVPYLSRLHSNALYAARWATLWGCLRGRCGTTEKPLITPMDVLCPAVAHSAPGWQAAPSPSLLFSLKQVCSVTASPMPPSTAPVYAVEGPLTASSLITPAGPGSPAWVTVPTAEGAVESGQVPADFSLVLPLHTLVLSEKENTQYTLSRSAVLQLADRADILVVHDMESCTVDILGPFRFIVLARLQRCKVRLGPCQVCLIQEIEDCDVAVAAKHLRGHHVLTTHLQCSGINAPELTESESVMCSMYSLAYPGLTEDYARAGLPQEHMASIDGHQVVQTRNETTIRSRRRSRDAVRRAVELVVAPGLGGKADLPYSHALLSSDGRFVHRGGDSGDVFLYHNELNGRDVLIRHVNGKASSTARRPVVLLLDVLGDVVIEDCSHCSIVLFGTPNMLIVRNCSHGKLFFVSRETVVENCTSLEIFAFATEFIELKECLNVEVFPWMVHCYQASVLLGAVVEGSIHTDAEDEVFDFYENNRPDLLNIVLQCGNRWVELTNCKEVEIRDVAWYQAHSSEKLPIFTLRLPSVPHHRKESECRSAESPKDSSDDGTEGSDLSRAVAADVEFLEETYKVRCHSTDLWAFLQEERSSGEGKDAEGESAAPLPLRQLVRLHDLIDCSLLRLEGSLSPLVNYNNMRDTTDSKEHRDGTAAVTEIAVPTVDLILERIQFGAIHIDDAVHTLLIRNCEGPLDIVVCAAVRVVLDGCTNVTLRTACQEFRAVDCAMCHVGLHVRAPPRYIRCTQMETSTLNITSRRMEALLEAVQVPMESNLFDRPLLQETTVDVGAAGDRDEMGVTSRGAKTTDDGDDTEHHYRTMLSTTSLPASVDAEAAPSFAGRLRQQVIVVAPLPGLCVGAEESAFLEELEERVVAESNKARCVPRPQTAVDVIVAELAVLAEAASRNTQITEADGEALLPELQTPTEGVATRPSSGATSSETAKGSPVASEEESQATPAAALPAFGNSSSTGSSGAEVAVSPHHVDPTAVPAVGALPPPLSVAASLDCVTSDTRRSYDSSTNCDPVPPPPPGPAVALMHSEVSHSTTLDVFNRTETRGGQRPPEAVLVAATDGKNRDGKDVSRFLDLADEGVDTEEPHHHRLQSSGHDGTTINGEEEPLVWPSHREVPSIRSSAETPSTLPGHGPTTVASNMNDGVLLNTPANASWHGWGMAPAPLSPSNLLTDVKDLQARSEPTSEYRHESLTSSGHAAAGYVPYLDCSEESRSHRGDSSSTPSRTPLMVMVPSAISEDLTLAGLDMKNPKLRDLVQSVNAARSRFAARRQLPDVIALPQRVADAVNQLKKMQAAHK